MSTFKHPSHVARALTLAVGILLVTVAVAVAFRLYRFREAELVIDLVVSGGGGTAQVLLDTGAGLAAGETESFPVSRGSNLLHVALSAKPLRAFRVDLFSNDARANVRRVTFRADGRKVSWSGRNLAANRLPETNPQIASDKRSMAFKAPGWVTRTEASTFWLLVLGVIGLTGSLLVGGYRLCQAEYCRGALRRAVQTSKDWFSDPDLITLGPSTLLLLTIPVVISVAAAGLRVHNSSVQAWNDYVPQRGTESILLGAPLGVRSDEWKEVPAELAPHSRLSVLPHASRWGYLVNPEVGASWVRAFNVLYPFVGVFTLLLYLTRNAPWISLIGALWIVLSSHFQWWSGMTEIGDISLLILGTAYFLYGVRVSHLVLGCVLLGAGAIGAVSVPYPPWHVPLGQWALLTIASSMVLKTRRARVVRLIGFKLWFAAVGAAVCAIVSYFLWKRLGHEVQVIANTVYPGLRRSASGGIDWPWLFSGYYDALLSPESFPRRLGNACEASSFLLLFPVTALVMVVRAIRGRAVPESAIVTLLHIGLLVWWMTGSVNTTFAEWTLLDRVPSVRAIGPLGVESIILATTVFAASSSGRMFEGNSRLISSAFALLLSVALLTSHAGVLRGVEPTYYTPEVVLVGIVTTSFLVAGLVAESPVVFALGVLAACASNLGIHPINLGFAPVTEKRIVQEVFRLHEQEPDEKWIVFGNGVSAKLLSASGADVFNNRSYPIMGEMAVLDPLDKHKTTWNRYSAFRHVAEWSSDGVNFTSSQPDLWGMTISPSSPLLEKLNIGFVAFTDEPRLESLMLLKQALKNPVNGFWLFRQNAAHLPSAALLAGKREETTMCGQVAVGAGVAAVRAQVPDTEQVSDVIVEQAGRWRRCLFGLPMAVRKVDVEAKRKQVGIRCPHASDEAQVHVYVFLESERYLHLSTSSNCAP